MQFWGRKWYFHQIKRKIVEGCKKASKLENILSIRLIELKELDTKNKFEKSNLPFLSKVSWVSSIRACVTNHPVYKHSLILAYQYLKKTTQNILTLLVRSIQKSSNIQDDSCNNFSHTIYEILEVTNNFLGVS